MSAMAAGLEPLTLTRPDKHSTTVLPPTGQAFSLKNGLKLLPTSKHKSSLVQSISNKENKLFTAA
jgi:hypothetical protein